MKIDSMSNDPLPHRVRLRPATLADAPLLTTWDREPHVIRCSTDDPDAEVAFGGIDWPAELAEASEHSFHLVAEVEGRPIGVLQVCDPHLEPTHYWGDVEPDQRAVDVWIGPPEALGQGYGTEMVAQCLASCFADPSVTGVLVDPLASNLRAQRFFRQLGFEVVERRAFGEDDCVVHRLARETWNAAGAPQGRG